MNPLRLWGLLCCVLGLLSGCAGAPDTRQAAAPKPLPDGDGGFYAATALADITPPLYLSIFGHGPEGRVATGVRLRLQCQVFLVQSGKELVALVPCDLQSSSTALQREVAKHLRSAGVPLTADRVFLMATHTHAGPAHYFEARRYSGPFTSMAPGFDPEVVTALAKPIAKAIGEAFAALKPACIGYQQAKLYGLTFNRSYIPFLANRPTSAQDRALLEEAALAEQQSAQASPDTGGDERFNGPERAVDPRMLVLRFDERQPGSLSCDPSGRLFGVLAVYGMHPTGVPNTNELYHGDIFGFAVRTAEACLRAAEPKPNSKELVSSDDGADCEQKSPLPGPELRVGLAQGVEGDVSPNLAEPSLLGARALGRRLGVEIARLAASVTSFAASGPVQRAYWELEFPRGRYGGEAKEELCEQAEVGIAMGAGTQDGPTRLKVIPEANAGYRLQQPYGCHRYKLPLRLGLGGSDFDYPRVGALGLLRIGKVVLATTPGELTTMSGSRIREALYRHLKEPLAIIGLTNHYFQYFTTEEEYDFQFYEGASTLYGPHSSQFLARHFECLAAANFAELPAGCRGPRRLNQVGTDELKPSPIVNRLEGRENDDQGKIEDAKLLSQVCSSTRDGERGWEFTITPLPPTLVGDRTRLSLQVREGDTGQRVIEDDRGSAIEVREIVNGSAWRIRWTPALAPGPSCLGSCERTFRLALRGEVTLESLPFRLDSAPPCARSGRR